MYRIDYSNLRNAVEIIYRFMTMPMLNNPECTLWNLTGIADILVNDGSGFLSEQALRRKIMGNNIASVSCVASTDKSDKRRVVLTYTSELDFMVLNFPTANGKLNPDEKTLLRQLTQET